MIFPGKAPDWLRQWAAIAVGRGWTVEQTRSGHYRWKSPDGGTPVITPGTPSGRRSRANIRADLRRGGLDI